MYIFTTVLLACVCIVAGGKPRSIIRGVDKAAVCNIKRSCVDCLQLGHCSWCETQKKCFSNITSPDFCKNDTIEYTDFGFNFVENARCGCGDGGPTVGCQPPGEDAACSGRGRCVCERCICDTYDNSTKFVMGDYCEFDNFSCDGPGCNEGPYSLKQPRIETEAP